MIRMHRGPRRRSCSPTVACGPVARGWPTSTPAARSRLARLFAIASITKTCTAALVFRLIEDGLLSLNDPLTRWLPDFPHARGVTVGQLLGSTSGLAALAPSDIAAILRRDPHHRFTDREVYLPPVCDPGACYHYQGPNYGLLGRIVEEVTGSSLASAYRAQLFRPLGLDQSLFAPQESVRGEVAIGYGRGNFDTKPADESVQEVKISPTTLPGAGGAIVATAEDVARFASALFGGRILEDGSRSTMLDFEAVHGLPGVDECFATRWAWFAGARSNGRPGDTEVSPGTSTRWSSTSRVSTSPSP